jgi:hypothetical protein
MQNILTRIFSINRTKPPKAVLHSFIEHFGDSINIEWHKEGHNYEAVFYIDEMEHIALFSPDGGILEKKRNLVLTKALPEISGQAKAIGEMMNLIEIERGDVTLFEVIARDLYLDRYYLLLDVSGTILDKKKL